MDATTCAHGIGPHDGPVRPYLGGPYCSLHAPWAMAGRTLPKPPADSTLAALLSRQGRTAVHAPAPSPDRAAVALRRSSQAYVAHEGQKVTSHAAARAALPKSGTQRRLVLDALYAAWCATKGGATDPELARHLSIGLNSIRPRRGELVDLWLVEDSGATRRHEGQDHTVWRVTSDALAALGYRPA